MSAARRLEPSAAAASGDLWGWCDPCGRWFYPRDRRDRGDRFACPVCTTPAARRGTRHDTTS